MNTAKKGRILEARARDWIGQGHQSHDVIRMRSAASKGPIDLMLFCLTCNQIRLVQVKANKVPGVVERATLTHLAERLPDGLSISIEHVVWYDGRPKQPTWYEYAWRSYKGAVGCFRHHAQRPRPRSSHPLVL